MKIRPHRVCWICLLVLVIAALSAHASPLPRIRILATGGTIAGAESNNRGRYESGTIKVQDLISAVPQLGQIAVVSAEQISNIGSQTMNNTIWLKLARRLNEVLNDSNVDGVVITHGTDTMEETSYFLSLVAKGEKPIVMTGAMRPATAVGADGPINIYEAVAVAANPGAKGLGVLVVLNDEIHYAREIEKSRTTGVNAFVSANRGLAGIVDNGRAVLFSPPVSRHGSKSEFSIDALSELPQVEIVYSYANFGRATIDFLVSRGVAGIVLAGVGDGNTTDEALAGLRDAAAKGVVVVRSARVASGFTRRNVEIDDDAMRFIASEELNPQKARVLLLLALTKTRDLKRLQQYFYDY